MRSIVLMLAIASSLVGLAQPAEARLGEDLVGFVQRSGFSEAEAVPGHEQLQALVDTYCKVHPGGSVEEGRNFDVLLLRNLRIRGASRETASAIATSLSWLRQRYGCDRIVSQYEYSVKFMDALPEQRYGTD